MSSVVKAVGNAVSSVVKGAVNVVKDVAKGVGNFAKQIGSSTLGKAVLLAATIYFGGAAIAGGYGGFATGGAGGILSGMGAGVSSAASSLSSAWTSAMAGNFAEAGSTLGGSWTSAAQQGAISNPAGLALSQTPGVSLTEAAPVAPEPVPNSLGAPPDQVARMPVDQLSNVQAPPSPAGVDYSLSSASNAPAGTGVQPPGNWGYTAGSTSSTPGMWDKVISSPYTAPALISGGMQVGGAYLQGQAQEKQLREQREYEARMAKEARERYNANVGAPLWSSDQAPIYQSDVAAWDPYAEARARNAARYAPPPSGLVARYMPTA